MIGAVLAGGRSTRLGRDKTRLRLPGDGRDMLARTVAGLSLSIRVGHRRGACFLPRRRRTSGPSLSGRPRF
nr:NTP transferase domain-containing protein [uncultured Bilophila sp.]